MHVNKYLGIRAELSFFNAQVRSISSFSLKPFSNEIVDSLSRTDLDFLKLPAYFVKKRQEERTSLGITRITTKRVWISEHWVG